MDNHIGKWIIILGVFISAVRFGYKGDRVLKLGQAYYCGLDRLGGRALRLGQASWPSVAARMCFFNIILTFSVVLEK